MFHADMCKLQYALKIIIVKFFSISDKNITLLYVSKWYTHYNLVE